MYTGIVQGLEKILEIRQGEGFITLVISNEHDFFHDVFIGASVAVNGTCLTATQIDLAASQVHFDVSDLTLSLTTLGSLKTGDTVNIERSAKVGAENGGHNLYGHIEGTAQVKHVSRKGETLHIDLLIPDGKIKYFFLTFLNCSKPSCQVFLISFSVMPASICSRNFFVPANLVKKSLKKTVLSDVFS